MSTGFMIATIMKPRSPGPRRAPEVGHGTISASEPVAIALTAVTVRAVQVALAEFTADRLVMLPFRGDLATGQATVRTEVKRSDGTRVPVNYTLRAQKELSTWVSAAAAAELGLANPFVDDQSHLRPTLVLGILESLKLNQSRGVPARPG